MLLHFFRREILSRGKFCSATSLKKLSIISFMFSLLERLSITVGASLMSSCVSDCFSSFPMLSIIPRKGQNSSFSITVLLSCAAF